MDRSYLWLAAITAAVFLLAYQVNFSARLDIGTAGDDPFLQGFYFAEEQGDMTFRWTGQKGTIAFDYVGSRPWRLRLRASGVRPVGPLAVQISVNGQPVATQVWGGEMADHELLIPRQQADLAGSLFVEITTKAFVAPPDTRQLGVLVDWVELEPEGWAFTAPPWLVLLAGVVIVVVGYEATDRLVNVRPVAQLAAPLLLALLAAAVIAARLQLSLYLPWMLCTVACLWVVAVRARQASWREWVCLVAVAALAFRVLGQALDFYHNGLPPGDFMIYYNAAHSLRLGAPLYDFVSAKGVPLGPIYKYPPLFAIELAPFTLFAPQNLSAIWFLLSGSCLALSGYLLWQSHPAPQHARVLGGYLTALILLLFQPAWESLIRGQLDSVILLLLVCALLLLRARRGEWLAGVLLALATMLKIYPGLLLVYLLLQRRWRALAAFGAATVAFLLLSGAVVGRQTLWRYATEILPVQSAAVPWPENQSLNGFFSRLVIPAAATTWYTEDPFPLWTKVAYYLAGLALLALTILLLWSRSGQRGRRFEIGYAAAMPLVICLWPIAWIHYQTLLLLPFWILARDGLRRQRRAWYLLPWFLLSFALVAFGNEYTVLIPALQQGWPRLLQSYKLYGVLLLWIILLWSARQQALVE